MKAEKPSESFKPGPGVEISAVIVNYNGSEFLPDNLETLKAQKPGFQRILVVDNASTDNSRDLLASRPGIDTLLLEKNIGYAAAANRGISMCGTSLVLVANADIRMEPGFVSAIQDHLEEYPETGLISPLLLRFDGKTVDSAGQECSPAFYPREKGYNQPLDKVQIKAGPVFSVCGAATVINRRAFSGIVADNAFYDEDFFMFWEDFDLGWLAREADIPVYFNPRARVHHFRSATLQGGFMRRVALALARPPRLRFHLVKNRYLTLIKHFRWRRHWSHIPAIMIKDLVWVGLLTISTPQIIIWLTKAGPQFQRAWRKRRNAPDLRK